MIGVKAGRATNVSGASVGILGLGVTLGLTDWGVEVFSLEGVELLEQENFLEFLADHIKLATTSLLVILWVAAPFRKVW